MTNMRLRVPSLGLLLAVIFALMALAWLLALLSANIGFWVGNIFLALGCLASAGLGMFRPNYKAHSLTALLGISAAGTAHLIIVSGLGLSPSIFAFVTAMSVIYILSASFCYIIRLKAISRR